MKNPMEDDLGCLSLCMVCTYFKNLISVSWAQIYKEEFYSGHFNILSRGRGEEPQMRSERCTLHRVELSSFIDSSPDYGKLENYISEKLKKQRVYIIVI